jgi:hypothetical protein
MKNVRKSPMKRFNRNSRRRCRLRHKREKQIANGKMQIANLQFAFCHLQFLLSASWGTTVMPFPLGDPSQNFGTIAAPGFGEQGELSETAGHSGEMGKREKRTEVFGIP